MGKNHHSRN